MPEIRSIKAKTTQQHILEILQSSRKPLSGKEIGVALQKINIYIHKSNIYRNIESLLRKGKISESNLMDKCIRYEIAKSEVSMIQVHCVACDSFDAVENTTIKELKKVLRERIGFKPLKENFLIQGLCRKCLTAS